MSFSSKGSPNASRKNTGVVPLNDGSIEDSIDERSLSCGGEGSGKKNIASSGGHLEPLLSSKLGNFLPVAGETGDNPSNKKQKLDHLNTNTLSEASEMEKLLAKLSPRPQSTGVQSLVDLGALAKLSEQQSSSDGAKRVLTGNSEIPDNYMDAAKLVSIPSTSASKPFDISALIDTAKPDIAQTGASEVYRLKQELLAANSKIALQEQELAQTRVIKHTLDQALGPPSEGDFNGREVTEQTISHLQNAFNATNPSFNQLHDGWNGQEDSQSDISDALSAGAYNRARGFWISPTQHSFSMSTNASNPDKPYAEALPIPCSPFGQDSSRLWSTSIQAPSIPGRASLGSQRVFSGSSEPNIFDTRFPGEQARYLQGPGFGSRRPVTQSSRGGSCFPAQNSPWGTFTSGSPSIPTSRSPPGRQGNNYQQVGLYPVPSYNQQSVGTPLSPTAAEFTSATNSTIVPWASSPDGGNPTQTYVSPLEPLNYRRLLDKNVSCDWRYIVDKIVCNNDQQASIFLQQKLKVGTVDQKYEIIEAIVHQAYPLMINRFGNFLVQRCFEHGTPEQIIAIANAIKGNTLSLSMDPFGCHVIQKAFDCVPEEPKAMMVHELLRRIPETVIHRYACHVWQKLFELRWSGEPPQIMVKVNDALRGMWHEVALGETGSLVVQNIFENCVEDEKRPAIEEVLAKIDMLAHGQFGNWCIQHICEHGAPHDKNRAVEHIVLWAVDYSMDQFASKIVEKCLKIGGSEFLDRYLARVCTGRTDRPRMPLIDIAGDQYGNYLIQWILMNAAPHQRELVASHIRKHMVSLRGSKFGSRVAMLCCNPSHTTRPGPGAGIQIGRFNNFGDERFQVSGQHGARFGRGNQWNPGYPPFR
ncbi:pumilio-family RNA binding repeat protein [Aspergillus steynii IBT 23096]|uniref:Pumilio-family RNA binding repeat protein n=1 Tax=Aspergillus steynii IBT 23096 TaxID=1392250 RepID=A0A2I2FR35_9EURO|nr:pumilio-family RNA binding repeat protein [Aspergillus steynii IBT 23096]PLB43098.1 pumilio-family RNA binding repeat protein [Aspergillus steynii IBT 23096]